MSTIYYDADWGDAAVSALLRARMYVLLAHDKAEANHDNIDSDLYMDSVQYEIMKKTDALIAEIDTLLTGKPSSNLDDAVPEGDQGE